MGARPPSADARAARLPNDFGLKTPRELGAVSQGVYVIVDDIATNYERAGAAAYPHKRYAIAEWGLWGMDDPAYVERMAAFTRTHSRMELLSYFNSKPGSLWDLGSKPRSRSAYRTLITPLGR